MAFDYSEMLGVVDELLEDFGREIILKKTARSAADATEPWNGPVEWDDATVSTNDMVRATALFIGRGMSLTQGRVSGQQVERGGPALTTEATDIFVVSGSTDVDVKQFTRVVDGKQVWGITKVVELKPGDTVMAYIVEVHQ